MSPALSNNADTTIGDRPVVPTRLAPGDPVYNDALEFLYTEAELLDENRLFDWLAMLADGLGRLGHGKLPSS